jgi:hypothetical protein
MRVGLAKLATGLKQWALRKESSEIRLVSRRPSGSTAKIWRLAEDSSTRVK